MNTWQLRGSLLPRSTNSAQSVPLALVDGDERLHVGAKLDRVADHRLLAVLPPDDVVVLARVDPPPLVEEEVASRRLELQTVASPDVIDVAHEEVVENHTTLTDLHATTVQRDAPCVARERELVVTAVGARRVARLLPDTDNDVVVRRHDDRRMRDAPTLGSVSTIQDRLLARSRDVLRAGRHDEETTAQKCGQQNC